MAEESEQMRPILQRAFGSSTHCLVRAAPILEAIAFHASPGERRGIQELPAADETFAESVPASKDVPDFLEHVLGKHIGVRTASAVLEALELSDQMRPAQLPHAIFVVAAVG